MDLMERLTKLELQVLQIAGIQMAVIAALEDFKKQLEVMQAEYPRNHAEQIQKVQ